jgi:putative hemolysin
MSTFSVEITIILLLILVNGFLSMTEIAVVSSRKTRLQQRYNDGDETARIALELANDPGPFLSSVQIGITLVGILAGAFGGATLARTIAASLEDVPALAPFSSSIGIAVVVVTITFLTLIFGELVPKRIAINDPEKISSKVARPMKMFARLASPLVGFLSMFTDLVLRVIGIRPPLEPPVTEEEVRVMIEQGTQAGVFEEAEQDMVVGVFRLGDLKVENLITPRTEIDWLDIEASPEEHQKTIIDSVRSRFPVGQGSLDNVLGVVQAKDLLVANLEGRSVDLHANLREPLFVPPHMSALKLLEMFKDSRLPMALVLDEYGGLHGLVTVNDILEAVVGDVSVKGERDEPEIVQREDGSWLIDGMVTVDEVSEVLDVENFPGEKEGHFQTLGGFIMTYLGRIPHTADVLEWGGLRFEVVDMDGLRVDKVLIIPLTPPQEDITEPISN